MEKKAKKAAKEAKDQKRKEWKEERDKFLKSLDGSVEGVKKFWKYWVKLKKEGGKEDRTELLKEGRVVRGVEEAEVSTEHMKGLNMRRDINASIEERLTRVRTPLDGLGRKRVIKKGMSVCARIWD